MMVVVFVKTTRRKRDDKTYEYLSLVETVRDGTKIGHRTLLRLGEVTWLRDTGQLERIVAALETHLERDLVDVAALAAEDAPAVGSVAAVWTLWQRLGLDDWFAHLGAERGAECWTTRCSRWSPTGSLPPVRSGRWASGPGGMW